MRSRLVTSRCVSADSENGVGMFASGELHSLLSDPQGASVTAAIAFPCQSVI